MKQRLCHAKIYDFIAVQWDETKATHDELVELGCVFTSKMTSPDNRIYNVRIKTEFSSTTCDKTDYILKSVSTGFFRVVTKRNFDSQWQYKP